MSDSTYCFDPWVIRQLETDDMGHEHWDEVDSVDYYEDDEEDDGEDEDEDDGEIEEEYEDDDE